MDYQEQMRRYKQRLASESSSEADEENRRIIALQVSCTTAQTLLQTIIQPELKELEKAGKAEGLPVFCKASSREIGGLETKFEVEIYLSHEGAKLRFSADPARHLFEVTLRRSREHKPVIQRMLYDEVTSASVQDYCGQFVTIAFPA